jgi:hypothetical protein
VLHAREDEKLIQISVRELVDKRLYFKIDSKQSTMAQFNSTDYETLLLSTL